MASTRGFVLGSTHFNRTGKEIAYGNKVARALGGKHYIVNTAENANGALPKRKWGKYGSKATACNPRNAGLGTQPTTNTASVYADAYLWVSRPGISSNGKRGARSAARRTAPAETSSGSRRPSGKLARRTSARPTGRRCRCSAQRATLPAPTSEIVLDGRAPGRTTR